MSDTELQGTESGHASPVKNKGSFPAEDSSDDESSEIVENGGMTDSSSTDRHVDTNGVTNGLNGNMDSDVSEDELDDRDNVPANYGASNGFNEDGEPEFKPKKEVEDSSESSDTEEDVNEQEDESEEEIIAEKVDENDGCVPSKRMSRSEFLNDEDNEELARSPSPVERSQPSIERSPSPIERSLSPVERSPSPVERSSYPNEFTSRNNPDHELPQSRSPSPERKDSRGSHGSSSYDDERASSLSPEPAQMIQAPNSSSKVSSPVSPPPASSQTKSRDSPITKIYTENLVDSDGEEIREKATRNRPVNDITQIYTTTLAQKEAEASSPKPERKYMGKAQGKDITQLYTAAFNKETELNNSKGDQLKPRRNENITKLYTGGFGKEPEKSFKGKPTDEFTNPKKHNMSTAMDKDAIKEAYNEVMADKNGVEWAAFIFDGPKLGVSATGQDFDSFRSHFGPDDRGFGYIKIMTGDEMSKRSKFVFCTWVGPNVSVMKKAKMSTDKALMKEIIQNLSVELQVENANELTMDHFKNEVDKAGGARYGTGERIM